VIISNRRGGAIFNYLDALGKTLSLRMTQVTCICVRYNPKSIFCARVEVGYQNPPLRLGKHGNRIFGG